MTQTPIKPVIAVLGATATGKSSLALKLAQEFGGEIINCDSRQVYKFASIGTAKPEAAQLKLINHHLYDIVEPSVQFNADEYLKLACEKIRLIWGKDRLPILAGGTGFYFSALQQGLGATGKDPKLTAQLQSEHEKLGNTAVVKKLLELDPCAADMVDLNNPRRVIRALEIVIISQKPLALNKPQSPIPEATFHPVVVTRPRKLLHELIAKRVNLMLEAGLETEVKDLFARYGKDAPGLQSIGYSEWCGFFDGNKTIEQVKEDIIIHTRQYARRQEIWFRKRPGTPMIDLSLPNAYANIITSITNILCPRHSS